MSKLQIRWISSLIFFSFFPLHAVDSPVKSWDKSEERSSDITYHVNFIDIPITEFIRYASKISHENFIYNNKELDFHVTFSSGAPISSKEIIKSLIRLLRMHQFHVNKEEHSYIIYKAGKKKEDQDPFECMQDQQEVRYEDPFLPPIQPKKNFYVYKLQYHEGLDIVDSLKKIAAGEECGCSLSEDLVQSIQGMQWIKATNSLLFSGRSDTIAEMQTIISSLDVPLRQVFIEVLVIETDVKKGLDYGLQWGAKGRVGPVGVAASNTVGPKGPFSSVMHAVGDKREGVRALPGGAGFDLGVIGDLILHKGSTFLTLGSLVSALQADGDSTIVLNQKIITQDSRHSKIFVGDNIPFAGSVVSTVGQSQQTTANIEYRDVGVSLNITPILGEGDIITLDIDEEITEAVEDHAFAGPNHAMGGIRTTKTNMVTHVHVPDKHFLVLSGMIRNAKSTYKSGLPCLGSIPWLGSAFSKNKKSDEKRNIIIFVRPQIIHSFQDYENITSAQEKVYENQAKGGSFQQGLEILPPVSE